MVLIRRPILSACSRSASCRSRARSLSPSFRDKLILSVFSQVAVCASGPAAYDLSPRCRALQAEELMQFALLAGELGGHAAGPGPAAGGGVDQHGLFDAGELAQ